MASEQAGSTGTTPPPAGTPARPGRPSTPTGPIGAGGQPGVVGSKPPPPAPLPRQIKGKAWNETHAGAQAEQGYAAFRGTFVNTLPAARRQLELIRHRPIGG